MTKKISELTNLLETSLADEDVVAVVDDSAPETKKISIGELAKRFHATVALSFTMDVNSKNNVGSIHGGLIAILTGQVLSTGVPINLTTGISRFMISVLAGSDIAGSLTITGDTVDRETGAITVDDTEIIVIDALTVDNSSVDGIGETLYSFTGAYRSEKWFQDACVISTTDLNLSDVDIFQLAFDQLDSHSNVLLRSLDTTFRVTNTNAFFAAHLYTVIGNVTTKKTNITSVVNAELLAADSELRFYRIRRHGTAGGLDIALDGTKDGVFLDLFFKPDNQQYFDGVAAKLWFHIYNQIGDVL